MNEWNKKKYFSENACLSSVLHLHISLELLPSSLVSLPSVSFYLQFLWNLRSKFSQTPEGFMFDFQEFFMFDIFLRVWTTVGGMERLHIGK